jgi:hypothetical protein
MPESILAVALEKAKQFTLGRTTPAAVPGPGLPKRGDGFAISSYEGGATGPIAGGSTQAEATGPQTKKFVAGKSNSGHLKSGKGGFDHRGQQLRVRNGKVRR